MKYIVQRNGVKYIENSSVKPKDALMRYDGQIPEADVAFAKIKESIGDFGEVIFTVTVNATKKAKAEKEKTDAKADLDVKKALKDAYKKKLKKGTATIEELNEIVLKLIRLI